MALTVATINDHRTERDTFTHKHTNRGVCSTPRLRFVTGSNSEKKHKQKQTAPAVSAEMRQKPCFLAIFAYMDMRWLPFPWQQRNAARRRLTMWTHDGLKKNPRWHRTNEGGSSPSDHPPAQVSCGRALVQKPQRSESTTCKVYKLLDPA